MIDWISLVDKQPTDEGSYLVTDGNYVDVAAWQSLHFNGEPEEYRWYPPDLSAVHENAITHWAFINLPQ